MKLENNIDISEVEGNASPEIKLALQNSLMQRQRHVSRPAGKPFRGFETEFASRMQLLEASILSKAEEPDKLEGRTVFEVFVDEDVLNRSGIMHGGCLAMIIDLHAYFPRAYLEANMDAQLLCNTHLRS